MNWPGCGAEKERSLLTTHNDGAVDDDDDDGCDGEKGGRVGRYRYILSSCFRSINNNNCPTPT